MLLVLRGAEEREGPEAKGGGRRGKRYMYRRRERMQVRISYYMSKGGGAAVYMYEGVRTFWAAVLLECTRACVVFREQAEHRSEEKARGECGWRRHRKTKRLKAVGIRSLVRTKERPLRVKVDKQR